MLQPVAVTSVFEAVFHILQVEDGLAATSTSSQYLVLRERSMGVDALNRTAPPAVGTLPCRVRVPRLAPGAPDESERTVTV